MARTTPSLFDADDARERGACGTGFIALRGPVTSRQPLLDAITALSCLEHRGACLADQVTGDGAGIMTDIPFDLLGVKKGEIALANLFVLGDSDRRERALAIFRTTFATMGISIVDERDVPHAPRVLGRVARETLPHMRHVFFAWPAYCRTALSFNTLLHLAKQKTRTRLNESGLERALFFTSLSDTTVVYKALSRASDLVDFYPDLQSSAYRTRFALFHRRFSTNTRTTWDKAQPFRVIAHNGEINTITGNRSLATSREKALGLPKDELLTRTGTSDSGNLNEMVEALRFRSSIPFVADALALIVPPAFPENSYYRFWSRACEPWDGPALLTYCDGEAIGARIDRNGFRPCRYMMTKDAFYLSSETGIFDVKDEDVITKGTLAAGTGVRMILGQAEVNFRDPSDSGANRGAHFDPRLKKLGPVRAPSAPKLLDQAGLFGLTTEERDRTIAPMAVVGKEPISSMGDTSALAVLSDEHRSFFDFFYQGFAQVTNPPLDYLREALVTDISVYLGRAPNVFAPKELIPPREALHLDTPVLSLGALDALVALGDENTEHPSLTSRVLDITFDRAGGTAAFRAALDRISTEAIHAIDDGMAILILSDQRATRERPPLPSLLALRAVVVALNNVGARLRASVVVDAGDARGPHAVAALISFGAQAVCPRLALELARFGDLPGTSELTPDAREQNVVHALSHGILRVMAKMGISVLRSYMSTKLFTPLGLGDEILSTYFHGKTAPIGGIGLDELCQRVLALSEGDTHATRPSMHVLKEDARGLTGERHSMTAARARVVHALVERGTIPERVLDDDLYREYLAHGQPKGPTAIRHLLDVQPKSAAIALDNVEPAGAILHRFGAGAMSFGAISKDSQRDIIVAMRALGARSNSGEGGENPWYFVDGTHATTKQIASARFGVTAEYVVTSEEIEIKVAQGAKPGEGGQLMGAKVNEEIARARHATAGTDLISPPPLHDIYSIEDLKELIYELKELAPGRPVVVKLVSGSSIGTIAVGVVKAGADVIHISGGDGGTGAAAQSSMRHAGLPWELGLVEVHSTLVDNELRHEVKLRADGGMTSGRDVIVAAMLGADEFAFGKLLLVAEGCIMARVCEKNTCPRGIATHDPRFVAKYRGTDEHVKTMMRLIAAEVREHLAHLGVRRLDDVIGRSDLLRESASERTRMLKSGLTLEKLLVAAPVPDVHGPRSFTHVPAAMNDAIDRITRPVIDGALAQVSAELAIHSVDRAVLSRLSGALASHSAQKRREARARGEPASRDQAFTLKDGAFDLSFTGSAGQGFAAFLVEGIHATLEGDANDSVAKSISGGRVVVRPPRAARFAPEEQVIIGNTALYGATGGTVVISGRAGDRFGVRNSGARAIVDGAGLHAAAYMTGGVVAIMGSVGRNAAAGMTGGLLFIPAASVDFVNTDTVTAHAPGDAELAELTALLELQRDLAMSQSAARWLADVGALRRAFVVVEPRRVGLKMRAA
jgi:glutamate synthase domain-containing protein 2/glutamate synthase domain-containing protein 1/glutamate synthase domain-containing protein 3